MRDRCLQQEHQQLQLSAGEAQEGNPNEQRGQQQLHGKGDRADADVDIDAASPTVDNAGREEVVLLLIPLLELSD